jgi:hypothetical protein
MKPLSTIMATVVSFCLYGNDPYYTHGLLENIALIGHHFPSWKVYVYVAPDVSESMLAQLGACSSVVLRPTGVEGAPNKTIRFFAIDEPEVALMFVRDADSRMGWKDRWAIRDFLASSARVHVIRDNKEHTAPIPGGLWGMRKQPGLSLRTLYEAYPKKTVEDRWKSDQNFLADMVYPKVYRTVLVHHGAGSFRSYEDVMYFPFAWDEESYCGRIWGATPYTDVPEPKRTVRDVLNFLVRR